MLTRALCLALLMLASAAAHAHADHIHAPAPETRADPVDRLVELARRAQTRHEFDHALTLLDQALARRPVNDNAWLLAASIHLVKGDPAMARLACQRLRQVPALVVLTCHAQAAVAEGNPALAARQLNAVIANIDPTSTRPDWLAWARGVAGDATRDSDSGQALRHYRDSLSLNNNPQVRAALADVLLEINGNAAAAAVLYEHQDQSLALQVRYLIAQQRLGRPQPATFARLDAQFQRWMAERNWEHAREMTRFYLDVMPNAGRARELAKINIGIQREREDRQLIKRTASQSEDLSALR